MEYWIDVLNQAMIMAIFAMSLNLLMGYAGQISVAHIALAGVGGYTAAYLSAESGASFPLAIVAAIAAAALVGALLSLPALRLGTEHLILLTLAFATVMVTVVTQVEGLGGQYGLQGIQPPEVGGEALVRPSNLFWLVLGFTVVAAAICWRLGESPFGRVLKGIREDEIATRALGKNVFAYKIVTFTATAGIAGAGGALLVYYNLLASPGFFDFDVTTILIAAVVIGGTGNLWGAILGAFVLQGIEPVLERVVDLAPEKASLWQLIVFGLLLLVVVRVRPAGLLPEGALSWRRHRRADAGAADGDRWGPAAAAESAGERGEPVLVARGLAKSFGGIRAVHDLDVTLQRGRITALIGPNGAGKTTVFNLLTGQIQPDTGTVELAGRDITGTAPHQATGLGLVRSFQDVRLCARLSLLENVMLAIPDQPGERFWNVLLRPRRVGRGERQTRARAQSCLDYVGLGDRGSEPSGSLGYGDQKLLAVARLMATGGDVLLVDEPASGVDRAALDPVLSVLERLRDEGRTICLVEHNLDVVGRLADHVVFMEEGTVTAEGTMEEITSQERLAAVYFGRRAKEHV